MNPSVGSGTPLNSYPSTRPFLNVDHHREYYDGIRYQFAQPGLDYSQIQMANGELGFQDGTNIEYLVSEVVGEGCTAAMTSANDENIYKNGSGGILRQQDETSHGLVDGIVTRMDPARVSEKRECHGNPATDKQVHEKSSRREESDRSVKDGERGKRKKESRRLRKHRARSSSSSSTESSANSEERKRHSVKRQKREKKCSIKTDKTELCNNTKAPDMSGREEIENDKCDVDASVVNPPTKPKGKNNLQTSFKRGSSAIHSEMKKTDKKVLYEDDNVIVHQDMYSVVFKNASDVYRNVNTHLNEIVDAAKKKLTTFLEEKLQRFEAKAEQMSNQKLKQYQRSVSYKAAVTDDNHHKFIIITPKSKENTYRLATASDRKEIEKKSNRCRHSARLLLELDENADFSVNDFRNILKSNALMPKAKNDFSFFGGDVKFLQDYLIEKINRWSASAENQDAGEYKITYFEAESQASTVNKRKAARKSANKKDAVQRTHNEEHTDREDEEASTGDDEVSQNNESGIVTERDSDGESSSSEQDERRVEVREETPVTVTKRRESKRKRSETSDSEEDIEEDYYEREAPKRKEKSNRRKRSHRNKH